MTDIDNSGSLKVILRKREVVKARGTLSQDCQHLNLAGRQAGRQGCVPDTGFSTPSKYSLDNQVHVRLMPHFWVWMGYVEPHSVLDLIRKDPITRRWREFQFAHVPSLAVDQPSQEVKQLSRAAAW